MLSGESATLILDTGYNTAPLSESISTEFSFDIDLRNILGDMYDKYENFEICLNSIINYARLSSYNTIPTQTPSPTFGASGVALIGMRGLNWLNNTLNSVNQSIAYFPNAFVIGGGGSATDGAWGLAQFKNPKCIMFSKPKNSFVTITVALYSVRNQSLIRCSNSVGEARLQLNYNFSIFGIEND